MVTLGTKRYETNSLVTFLVLGTISNTCKLKEERFTFGSHCECSVLAWLVSSRQNGMVEGSGWKKDAHLMGDRKKREERRKVRKRQKEGEGEQKEPRFVHPCKLHLQ